MLKFHLDENVDHAIAGALHRRGIDVTATTDAGLLKASDEVQLTTSSADGRVIVTHDTDLLALHGSGFPHAGIAFCAVGTRTIGQIASKLAALSRNFNPEDMRGRVEFL